MKKFKKILCAIVSFTIVISCIGMASMNAFAFNDHECYSCTAVDGTFPLEGTIVDWNCYYIYPGADPNKRPGDRLWYEQLSGDKYATIYPADHQDNGIAMKFEPGNTIPGGGGGKVFNGITGNIDSGVLDISLNMYFPSGKHMSEGDKYIHYYAVWGYDDPEAKIWNAEQGMMFSAIMNDPQRPLIGFTTNGTHNAVQSETSTSGVTRAVSLDEWHTVRAVINYDAQVVDYYLDNVYVDSNKPHGDIKNYRMNYLQGSEIRATEGTIGNAEVKTTALKINRYIQKDSAPVLKSNTKNSLTLGFDGLINTSLSNISVVSADGIGHTVDSVTVDGNDVTISVDDDFDCTQAVAVTFGDGVDTVMGRIPVGATYLFALAGEKSFEKKTLIDLDFDEEWQDGKPDTSEFYYVRGQNPADEDTKEFNDDPKNTNYYCDQVDNDGGKKLRFEFSDFWPTTYRNTKYKALKFPFADGQTVSSGKLTMEFDAGYFDEDGSTATKQWVLFGLNDTTRQEDFFYCDGTVTDEHKLNAVTSNSTAFLGLTTWDASKHSVTVGSDYNRTKPYDYYCYDGYNDGSTNTKGSIGFAKDNTMHHYKIVADLDANTYSVSMDGGAATVVDGLPGDVTKGVYDSFVLTMVHRTESPAEENYFNADIDNLMVEYEPSQPIAVLIDEDFSDPTSIMTVKDESFKNYSLEYPNYYKGAPGDFADSAKYNRNSYVTYDAQYIVPDYAGGAETDENRRLRFKYIDAGWADKTKNHRAIVFPFNRTVSSGTLDVEFDFDYSAGAPYRNILFGLYDEDKAPTTYVETLSNTAKPGDNVWASAITFAGISAWGANDGAFVRVMDEEPFKIASWYTQTYSDIYSLKGWLANVKGNQSTMHHYKIHVDLDNNTYELSLDNNVLYTSTDMPGDWDEFGFSEFHISLDGNNNTSDTTTWIDNIKVTAENPYYVDMLKLESMSYSSDGEIFKGMTESVTEGNDLYFTFNDDVLSLDAEVDGVTVDTEIIGNTVMISRNEFGTDPLGSHTIELKNITADKYDTLPAVTIAIKIVSSELWQVSLAKNDNGAQMTLVINDPEFAGKYVMVLAAYDENGYMTALKTSAENQTSVTNLILAEGDAFKNAATLRGFVFNTLVDLVPYCNFTEK